MIDVKNLTCHYCDLTLKLYSSFKNHCLNSETHHGNVLKSGIPKNEIDWDSTVAERNRIERNSKVLFKDGVCKIPFSNGIYITVSDFLWDNLKNYAICYHAEGEYGVIKINNDTILLHHYIYYTLYHRAPRKGYVVDHINKNSLDT